MLKKTNQKISTRYYGPYEILEKIGTVAYKLALPPKTDIHPVFHVSLLKKHVSRGEMVIPRLPKLNSKGEPLIEPHYILARRLIKRNNAAVPQILVKWTNLGEEDASWEDYYEIQNRYPQFDLRDKINFKEGRESSVMSSSSTMADRGRNWVN